LLRSELSGRDTIKHSKYVTGGKGDERSWGVPSEGSELRKRCIDWQMVGDKLVKGGDSIC
jgi:hypothetical protein